MQTLDVLILSGPANPIYMYDKLLQNYIRINTEYISDPEIFKISIEDWNQKIIIFEELNEKISKYFQSLESISESDLDRFYDKGYAEILVEMVSILGAISQYDGTPDSTFNE